VKLDDPGAYVSAFAIVMAVAVAASLLPAMRAARAEPTSALRLE
jgi:ABC-type lipoprotein release transport system permease subunit